MSDKYSASQIKVIEGIEHVRMRPGMYIVGSSKTKGLHNLVFEVIYYAIDDVLNGECDRIEVEINSDNSITVSDNGLGIPVDPHHRTGISQLESIMTDLGVRYLLRSQ
jgi:DNA gyrase subunit B